MTILNIIEEIQEIFPNLGDTQIIKELDRAQKRFAMETGIYTVIAELENPNQAFYWDVPEDFQSLISILAYNNNNPVYLDSLCIDASIVDGKIVFFSTTDTPISTLPGEIDTVYIIYEAIPETLADISSTLSIEEYYHEALLAKVMERAFARYPMITKGEAGNMYKDFYAAKYWKEEYMSYVREAKKQINIDKDKRGFNIILQDSVKIPVLPQSKDFN